MPATSEPTADRRLVLLVAVTASLAFLPSLLDFGSRLWGSDHYSFVPMYLLALGYFALRAWQTSGPFPPSFSTSNAAKWLFPALLLATAIWLRRPWLAGIAAVVGAWALIHTIGGRRLFERVRGIWLALWLCIPFPFNLDKSLVTSLQQFASQQASRVLDWLGFRHLLTGVLINFPERTFEVEEACSGVQSLYASLAAVSIYCIARKQTLLRSLFLLIVTVGWVLALNVFRIVLVVVAELGMGVPLADDIPHQITGYVVFALVILFAASTERLVEFLLPPKAQMPEHTNETKPALAMKLDAFKLPPIRVASTIACLFVGLALFWLVRPSAVAAPLRESGVRLDLVETSLPLDIAGWTRESFEIIEREPGDINGEVSYTWTYTRSGLKSTISVDGPFGKWHDLGYCYSGVGWKLTEASDIKLPGVDGVVASELHMEDGSGLSGHVVFASFQSSGESVSPPPVRVGVTGGARIQGGVSALFVPRDTVTARSVFAVQALCKVPLSLTDVERESHAALLSGASASIRSFLSLNAATSGKDSDQ